MIFFLKSVGKVPGNFLTELRNTLAANELHQLFDEKPLGAENILNSVRKIPRNFLTDCTRLEAILSGIFPELFRQTSKKSSSEPKKEQAHLGPALVQPSLAQAGTLPKPAQARAQIRPDHMNLTHFSEIWFTWFEAESGFRIEIWMRQYRQIVQNVDPRLMKLALTAPDK